MSKLGIDTSHIFMIKRTQIYIALSLLTEPSFLPSFLSSPIYPTNPLTFRRMDGRMDGSPSTQIRLNIKKNKSSACTRRRRDAVGPTDRQTGAGGRQLNRGACHATLGRGLNGNMLSQCYKVTHVKNMRAMAL